MRIARIVMVVVGVLGGRAHADEWHVGTNLRSELSTHAVRFDGGYRIGRLDLIGVVDPMVWTDGELDLDAIAEWQVNRCGYAALVGWRPTSIALSMGRQWQETLLLGVTAPLPKLHWLDLQVGVEVATTIVKHGGGLPTNVTSFANSSEIGDNISISMFLRIGYAHTR
jgi:hypothetical protein